MEYRQYIQQTIAFCKKNEILKVRENGILKAHIVPVSYYSESHGKMIMQWREENQIGFANRFTGTMEKTKNWFENVLLPNNEKILFFVNLPSGMVIGHLGYSSFDFENRIAEIDNVVRGIKSIGQGIMSLSMQTLLDWGKKRLMLNDIYLRVLSDNPHAITFYERLGFEQKDRIPLFKVEKEDITEWIPMENCDKEPDKYFIVMKLCQ